MISTQFHNATDFKRIKQAIGRKRKTVLHRTGAYARKVMRSGIRFTKKRKSRPGERPRAHTRPGLKTIFYVVDPLATEVKVAPLVYENQPALTGASSVPELLEAGGQELLVEWRTGEAKPAQYLPRPWVQPVLPDAASFMAGQVERVPLR